MKKTGAWLVRYGLEQLGITHTFGIPGVHNTEIYDELDKSKKITPILVTHEGCGAFMADAISRTSGSQVGVMVIVPAAGATHAASGIGEAWLDGIPMLVISGGVRSDSKFKYQLHEMDQEGLVGAITKGFFKIKSHNEIISTLFQAYRLATEGEPGPVFIEVPVNIQIDQGPVLELPEYLPNAPSLTSGQEDSINEAAKRLLNARQPGIFLGWGAVDATTYSVDIAERLGAPVATTLQGLSAFSAAHPLHAGMGFGPSAVPAARAAFKNCDCLLAVGTRFGEIATGSFGVEVPEQLIHVDINPDVLGNNYPAIQSIYGDAVLVLKKLSEILASSCPNKPDNQPMERLIQEHKQAYQKEWLEHKSDNRVNPAVFFTHLRQLLADDAIVVADDGNHTFLTAELMPIYKPRHFISPTDFNCMGYAVPATIAAKLINPEKTVVGIIGDGAFMMTCTELSSAAALGVGAVFTVFNDGELAQIAQAQSKPYNRKTCTQLGRVDFASLAKAFGAHYIGLNSNQEVDHCLNEAMEYSGKGCPVLLDVKVDYSKLTCFTKGVMATNLKRLELPTKVRMVSRALWRKVAE